METSVRHVIEESTFHLKKEPTVYYNYCIKTNNFKTLFIVIELWYKVTVSMMQTNVCISVQRLPFGCQTGF